MRVMAIGRGDALLETCRRVASSGRHQLVLVITAKPNAEYRAGPADFAEVAEAAGAPFIETQVIDGETLRHMHDAHADVGVSVNWVTVLGGREISTTRLGILNGHFGDVPRYRGNAPTNWAILQGEAEAGLTVHWMEPDGLDSGDFVPKRYVPLGPSTTIGDLVAFSDRNWPEMFMETLDAIEAETLKVASQASTGMEPLRTYPRLPRDGRIEWSTSAEAIDRLVRATTHPYPGAFTYYRRSDSLRKLYVWASRVVAETETIPRLAVPGQVLRNDRQTGETWVQAGEGVIALVRVSDDESEEYSPGQVWRSIRLRLGMDVEDEIYRLIRRS